MQRIIYIHGLGSSKRSSKFKELKKVYPQIECFEWDENDILMISKLIEFSKTFDKSQEIIIIGDSTGGNFAIQLRMMIEKYQNTYAKLVLLNPLLDISKVHIEIPENVKNRLSKITEIHEALIFISKNDDIVDHTIPESISLHCKIVKIDDTHKLSKFPEYLHIIDNYINQIWL